MSRVVIGFGVSLQPAFYASACPSGVGFRGLSAPTPQVAVQMAWRRESPPSVVRQFIETARRLRDGNA